MPRPKLPIRPVKLLITLPSDVDARLRAYLHSERLDRVPQGAFQQFFLERIEEFFSRQREAGNRLLREMSETPEGRGDSQ